MAERVRVLLDEGVPEKLRTAFSDAFTVETVRYRRWTGMKNGALLQAAEEAFDALVTVDRRLPQQQNVGARDNAVVVLDAPGTKFSDLVPLIPSAETALLQAQPGR